MTDLNEIVTHLERCQSVLSKKSIGFLKGVGSTGNSSKDLKLIYSILFETLIEYKDVKSASASHAISSCMHYLISKWDASECTVFQKLPSLLKACLERIRGVEKDLALFAEVGWSVLKYGPVQEKGEENYVGKLFVYHASKLISEEIACSYDGLSISTYIIEFQLLLVKRLPFDGPYSSILNLLLISFDKHISKGKFSQNHVDCVVETCFDILPKVSEVMETTENVTSEMTKWISVAVKFGGYTTLELDNATDCLHEMLALLDSSSHCPQLCGTLMEYVLGILTRNAEFSLEFSKDVFEFLKKLCLNAGFHAVTMESCAKLTILCEKHCSRDTVETILALLHQIVEQKHLCKEFHVSEHGVKFLGSLFSVTTVVVNEKCSLRSSELVVEIVNKILKSLVSAKVVEKSRIVPVVANLGIVLTKILRKSNRFLEAMAASETVISIIPYENSLQLVDQWVKAKYSKCVDTEANAALSSRSLTDGLIGQATDEYLVKALIREMNMCVSLGMDAGHVCSITSRLLKFDRMMIAGHVPSVVRNHVKANFEAGNDAMNLFDFFEENELQWENIIELKIFEFMQKWHLTMKHADSVNADCDLREIHEICSHLEKAVTKKRKLKFLLESCKATHEASSIACLFGNHKLGLRILGNLLTLLQLHEGEDVIVKRNICSALCEIASCYLSLRQIPSAEQYVDRASNAWSVYWKCMSKKKQEAYDTKHSKLLYFKVHSTMIRIYNLCGKTGEANRLLDQCIQDDYLNGEKWKSSTYAIYCGCLLLNVSCDRHVSGQSRLLNLINLLKMISTLKRSVFPDMSEATGSHSKERRCVQRFGTADQNKFMTLSMQVNLISMLLSSVGDIIQSYILAGDPSLAKIYMQNGTLYAKYLHLKNWFLTFSLLGLRVVSMLGLDLYPQVAEQLCKNSVCGCESEQSWTCADDSGLFCNDTEEVEIDEDESDSEILGSPDEDAIEIPTKKLDILGGSNCDRDLTSSPRCTRRVVPKKSKISTYFKAKQCSCESDSVLESSEPKLKFGVIHVNYCIQSDNRKEAMETCDRCLEIIFKTKDTPLETSLEPISKVKFFGEIQAELTMAKAALLHADNKKSQAVTECKSVEKIIDECGVVEHRLFTLKSKACMLLADMGRICKKTDENQVPNIELLNSFIDALSQAVVSHTHSDVVTPVATRTSKRVQQSKSTKKRTRATSAKAANSKADKSGFEIYDDNAGDKLPVPTLNREHSPAHDPSVYDMAAQAPPNIRIARKTAQRRYKAKFGTFYTNDDKERVRGRTAKPKSTSRTKSRIVQESVSEETHINSDIDVMSNLQEALTNALHADDFLTTKLSAQRLSQHYFASFETSQDYSQKILACAYHMLSVGIPTRSALNIHSERISNMSRKGNAIFFNRDKEMPRSPFQSLLAMNTDFIGELQDVLPETWTVCVISAIDSSPESKILLTRLRKSEVFHTQAASSSFFTLLESFQGLMTKNIETLKSRDRSYWWTHRRILNEELKNMMESAPAEVFGYHAGVLLGSPLEDDQYQRQIENLLKTFDFLKEKAPSVKVLLDSWRYLSVQQKLCGVLELIGNSSQSALDLAQMLEVSCTKLKLHKAKRGHVILILDKHVQLLPWESSPLLLKSSVSRMPSVDLLRHHLSVLKSTKRSVVNDGVDMNDVSYILNPNGDLKKTEERMREWFQGMKSWRGIVAREPDHKEWISSITEYDLFIYCGHGSGDSYISGHDFHKINTRAVSLLMGCNSGRLVQTGVFEPNGIILNYLISGSPCIVACLWKVTDKDIDYYLRRLLEKWADGSESPVSSSANFAREGMTMPYINGSACVIYGLPVHCQASAVQVLNALS